MISINSDRNPKAPSVRSLLYCLFFSDVVNVILLFRDSLCFLAQCAKKLFSYFTNTQPRATSSSLFYRYCCCSSFFSSRPDSFVSLRAAATSTQTSSERGETSNRLNCTNEVFLFLYSSIFFSLPRCYSLVSTRCISVYTVEPKFESRSKHHRRPCALSITDPSFFSGVVFIILCSSVNSIDSVAANLRIPSVRLRASLRSVAV